MKMIPLILMCLALGLQSVAHATPIDLLKENGCDQTLEALAKKYLKDNAILVSIYEDQSKTNRSLDIDALVLCASTDLDPGSWNLRRETAFCNKAADKVTLFTYGNLYCDDEQVLGVKSISLPKAQATK